MSENPAAGADPFEPTPVRAVEPLVAQVYEQLRAIAQRQLMQERVGHTLQATALVHEAYLKLAGQRDVDWQNRAHFFGIAARLMRRILVDDARSDRRVKRGGGVASVSLADVDAGASAEPPAASWCRRPGWRCSAAAATSASSTRTSACAEAPAPAFAFHLPRLVRPSYQIAACGAVVSPSSRVSL